MEHFVVAVAVAVAFPVVAYFSAKYAAYGFLRGIERYRIDYTRHKLHKKEER